jgi:tRNA(Ile)-lysidine synthase
MLLNRFKASLLSELGVSANDQVMLAVSGGIDSAVMTHLFYEAGIDGLILHCNFGLRGAESDADEAFVRSMAARYEMPVFVQSFQTADYAEEMGISIQMAARELRYTWFEELSEKQGCRFIATAHNMNDTVETVLNNLARGTGLRGLAGIPAVNGKFIRPLLQTTREDIETYARAHHISYREDSSNASRKYHRNRIRHDILPVFEEINPAFLQAMYENINRITEALSIYQKAVNELRDLIFTEKEDHIEVETERLKQLQPRNTWLYELFSAFNFTSSQCVAIGNLLESDSGKQSVSTTHRLYKDRDRLLIYRNEDSTFDRYYIDSPANLASLPFPMDIEIVDAGAIESIPSSTDIALLDLDAIEFPLTIRKWQQGDYFFPLGMKQMKKLSDFFIDMKVPVPEKKRTWIMATGKKIVWIMGKRIDDRFKVTDTTRRILRLEMYGEPKTND